MQSFQKGFGLVAPLIILCLLVGGGGVYWYIGFKNSNSSTTQASNTNEYKPLFAQNEGPGAPNCYYLRGDEVFVSSDGGKNFTIVPGADAKSFKDQSIFGLCFGTDTSHVYRDAQTIAGYNPATFAWLWYTKTKGGPVLFAKKNATSIGKFTFSEGKNTAYTGESVIPNGDPQTFKEWVGSYDFAPWAVDKNNVYCQGNTILEATPSSVSFDNTAKKTLSVIIKGVRKTIDSNCVVADDAATVEGMTKYTDTDFRFSFWYPDSWKKVSSDSSDDSGYYKNDALLKQIDLYGPLSMDLTIRVYKPAGGVFTELDTQKIYFSSGKWIVQNVKQGTAIPNDSKEETMGNLPVLCGGLGCDREVIVPLDTNTFVLVAGNAGYVRLHALAATIVATDVVPKTSAEQLQTLKDAKAAFPQ